MSNAKNLDIFGSHKFGFYTLGYVIKKDKVLFSLSNAVSANDFTVNNLEEMILRLKSIEICEKLYINSDFYIRKEIINDEIFYEMVSFHNGSYMERFETLDEKEYNVFVAFFEWLNQMYFSNGVKNGVKNRKYLDDLGVPLEKRPENYSIGTDRELAHQLQEEEYGFNVCEIYDLKYSFHLWLYERVKMYREKCLEKFSPEEFHTYTINGITKNELTWIDEMIGHLEMAITIPYYEKEHDLNRVAMITRIFHEIGDAIWI